MKSIQEMLEGDGELMGRVQAKNERFRAAAEKRRRERNTDAQVRRAVGIFAQSAELPDAQAMEIAELYPDWEPDKAYSAGNIVKYGVNADGGAQLYRVAQAHTSQAGWTPDNAASLFSKVGFTQTGTPVWVQPTGAHNAYAVGDVVSHNGKTWTSTANGNTWEPGVYGWTENK